MEVSCKAPFPGYRAWKEGVLLPEHLWQRLVSDATRVDEPPAVDAPAPPEQSTASDRTPDTPVRSPVPEPSVKIFEPLSVESRMQRLREGLTNNSRSDRHRQLVEMRRLLERGPDRHLQAVSARTLKSLDAVRAKFPNFSEFFDLLRDHIHLARLSRPAALRLPTICLLGPPGIGKTAVIRRALEAIELPSRLVSCPDISAAFVLSGSTASWSGSNYGLVAERLTDGSPANSCIILDEIDKLPLRSNYPADGALYRLLEPTTARQFRDEFLDVQLDASYLTWVATANEFNGIPSAIRSRLAFVRVRAPNREEMDAVVESVNDDLRREYSNIRRAFTRVLPKEVKTRLAGIPPRNVRKVLLASYARAAARGGKRSLIASDLQMLQETAENKPFGFHP